MVLHVSTWTRVGLLGGLVTLVIGVAQPASATDDGYQNVFTSVLGAVGVLPQEQSPEIDYRERPPLVLPPKQVLVKPQQPGAMRSAAWPVDPDVARRKKASEDAKAPIPSLFSRGEDRPLSKDEALKYRAEGTPADVEQDAYGCSINHNSMSHCRSDPDEMKREEERFKQMNPDKKSDALTAGVEPERLYLTQPPKGYLKATKTLTATHEAPQPKRDDSSPLSTYIHPVETRVDPLDH